MPARRMLGPSGPHTILHAPWTLHARLSTSTPSALQHILDRRQYAEHVQASVAAEAARAPLHAALQAPVTIDLTGEHDPNLQEAARAEAARKVRAGAGPPAPGWAALSASAPRRTRTRAPRASPRRSSWSRRASGTRGRS